MKVFSGMLFVWWDELFRGKKIEKNMDNLDEIIEARKLLLRKNPDSKENIIQKSNQNKLETKKLEMETDPESQKRKEILHQIYDKKLTKLKDETDYDFFIRVLNLKKESSSDEIKKAYKEKAKEFHPDRFDFSLFDKKTKEKLQKKVHENFLVIQKAYDYLKKAG
jgi:DnaJ-domain-containing protein 1